MRRVLLACHSLVLADLLGRIPDLVIVDELSDVLVHEGQVSLSQHVHIFPRHVIDEPKCYSPIRPEKQYGKKYRRLLRGGKR